MHRVMIEVFTIKFLTGDTILKGLKLLQVIKLKYKFSEIKYHVLGYWNWFAEINDSTPLDGLNLLFVVAVYNCTFLFNLNNYKLNTNAWRQQHRQALKEVKVLRREIKYVNRNIIFLLLLLLLLWHFPLSEGNGKKEKKWRRRGKKLKKFFKKVYSNLCWLISKHYVV